MIGYFFISALCNASRVYLCTLPPKVPPPASGFAIGTGDLPLPTGPQRERTAMKLRFVVLGGANAGKTSILRRYFHGTFDVDRMPTMGADFYSKKVEFDAALSDAASSHAGGGEGGTRNVEGGDAGSHALPQAPLHPKAAGPPSPPLATSTRPISVQVWDTPGRERYVNNDNRKARYTASFSDSFFKNVDAAVLVYDVSSSTSFTHVLKWHAELMERIRRMEATGERTRPLPIVIVGNKTDIFQERDTQKKLRKKEVVRQRDVLGVAGKTFRGQDYRYEYSASPPPAAAATASSRVNCLPAATASAATSTASIVANGTIPPASSGKDSSHRNRFEISTYMGTSNKTNYLEAILNNEVYRGSYLDSLLSSEDNSHPDKDMVIVRALSYTAWSDILQGPSRTALPSNL